MIGYKIFNNWLYERYKLIQMEMHDNKAILIWDPCITQIMACKDWIIRVISACLHELVWHISCTELLLYPHRFLRGKTAKSDELHCSSSSRRKNALSVSSSDSLTPPPPQCRMSTMEIILTGDAEDILNHTASLFRRFSPAAHCVWFIVHRDGHLLCVFWAPSFPEHCWGSPFPLISPNQIHGVLPRLMGGWN